MANILKCDGCGKLSPDEKGNHIANHWFEVTVKPRSGYRPDLIEHLYCPECLGYSDGLSGIIKMVKNIIFS